MTTQTPARHALDVLINLYRQERIDDEAYSELLSVLSIILVKE